MYFIALKRELDESLYQTYQNLETYSIEIVFTAMELERSELNIKSIKNDWITNGNQFVLSNLSIDKCFIKKQSPTICCNLI